MNLYHVVTSQLAFACPYPRCIENISARRWQRKYGNRIARKRIKEMDRRDLDA